MLLVFSDKYTACSYKDTISERLFLSTNVSFITPRNSKSMQEFAMQENKQKLLEDLFSLQKDNWHVESEKPLQPEYLIIIVNRFNIIDDIVTRNRSLICLDLKITVDHHGNSMHYGHYTSSVTVYAKTNFYSICIHAIAWIDYVYLTRSWTMGVYQLSWCRHICLSCLIQVEE